MTGRLMNHLDLEDLAAYIEGKLSPAERAAITAHLADCDDCFPVFAEAVRIGQEEEDEAAAADPVLGGDPAPGPFERRKTAFHRVPGSRRPANRWLPAAAAAVLALALGTALHWSINMRPTVSKPVLLVLNIGTAVYRPWLPISTSEIFASLSGVPGLTEKMSHGPVLRGGSQETGVDSAEAFKLGVLEVDLGLSLARDKSRAAEICRQIANILAASGFLEEETNAFRNATSTLLSGKAPYNLDKSLGQTLEEAKPAFSSGYLDFGRWAEAGRLSAIARNERFFASQKNRSFLAVLQDDPTKLEDPDLQDEKYRTDLPSRVQNELEKIGALWNDPAVNSAELGEAFNEIIEYYFRLPPESLGSN